ncbi:MAG: hypothetical protein VKL39_09580, partial [Leptolyngbyaceae bacterium]|nr:hypothetical protein [Leptolyngbyaceae bacterium]
KSLSVLIPPEDWAQLIPPHSSGSSSERINAFTVQSGQIPLESAIALIPLVLYTHHDVGHTTEFADYLYSLDNSLDDSSRLPISLPLTPGDRIVRHMLSTLLNQEFSASTYLSSLIRDLEDEHLKDARLRDESLKDADLIITNVITNVLLAVEEAVGDRRGAAWLLESLKSITSDGSSWPEPRQVQSVARRSSVNEEPLPEERLSEEQLSGDLLRGECLPGDLAVREASVMDMAVGEAIAIGCILYCFCSTPTQYNTAIVRLKQLIQKSMLEDTLIVPACSLLGSFLGCHIGIQGFRSSKRPNLPTSTDRTDEQNPFKFWSSASADAPVSQLGTYLWARWSGIDRYRLHQLLGQELLGQELEGQLEGQEVEPLKLTTAVPGVIRRFGN